MGNKQDYSTTDQRRRRAPKGHFVVYVGEGMKRYELPLSCLKNPKLQQLLQKAADEFGFNAQTGIVLPCDDSTFLSITDFVTECSS